METISIPFDCQTFFITFARIMKKKNAKIDFKNMQCRCLMYAVGGNVYCYFSLRQTFYKKRNWLFLEMFLWPLIIRISLNFLSSFFLQPSFAKFCAHQPKSLLFFGHTKSYACKRCNRWVSKMLLHSERRKTYDWMFFCARWLFVRAIYGCAFIHMIIAIVYKTHCGEREKRTKKRMKNEIRKTRNEKRFKATKSLPRVKADTRHTRTRGIYRQWAWVELTICNYFPFLCPACRHIKVELRQQSQASCTCVICVYATHCGVAHCNKKIISMHTRILKESHVQQCT